jgi:hypothetical protein
MSLVDGTSERVGIDLSDGANLYDNAGVSTVTPGSANLNTGGGSAWVVYNPNGNISAGTIITITLEDVEPTTTGESYEVGFSRGSADTANTTFSVKTLLGGNGTLVYQSNNNKLSLITGNNSQVNSTGQNPAVIGQPGTGLSGDGTPAIPYLDNGNNPDLVLAYLNGSTKELVGKNSGSAPRSGGTIATGVFDGSGESVFYAGASNNNLYRVNASEGPTSIATPNQGIKGVVDIGDIDNDSEDELLYLDSSSNLRYIDKSGSSTTISISIGSNAGIGVGEVVNFSGTEQLLYVDGSQNLALADSNGKTETFSIGNVSKTRPAAADVDGDGETEFVYVGSDNNYLNYVDDPESSSNLILKLLKDASGNPVEVKPATGVLSGN